MWTTILWGLGMFVVFGGIVVAWLVAMVNAGVFG